jgi:hypothetical protein
MAVGDKQKLITEIVGIVLNERPQIEKFNWFINQHQKDHFKGSHNLISQIFTDLNGNNSIKRIMQLQSDAYFGGKYNFLFEFDEIQHFSTARLKTLDSYPKHLKLNYSVADWKKWCTTHSTIADGYRFNKATTDFSFNGGRTCQRAYPDCFRDLLPQHNGLNPTLRIAEFEVNGISQINNSSVEKIKTLLKEKLKFL